MAINARQAIKSPAKAKAQPVITAKNDPPQIVGPGGTNPAIKIKPVKQAKPHQKVHNIAKGSRSHNIAKGARKHGV